MTEKAWMTKRFFPFAEGIEDLDGSSETRGRFGFGNAPPDLCGPHQGSPPVRSRNTGWGPVIKSLAYVSVQAGPLEDGPTPAPGGEHDVTIQFVQQQLTERDIHGSTGGVVQRQRWVQVPLLETGIRVAYLVGLPVPVDDETGTPFGMRITTAGRENPSMLVMEYQWGRFVRDTSAASSRALGFELVDTLTARARELGERFLERIRGGGG